MCFPLTGFSGGESSLDMSLSECKESGSIIRIEREKIVFVVNFVNKPYILYCSLVNNFEKSAFVLY